VFGGAAAVRLTGPAARPGRAGEVGLACGDGAAAAAAAAAAATWWAWAWTAQRRANSAGRSMVAS
jgi:hypothetical protein